VFSLREWNSSNCKIHLQSKHKKHECPEVFDKTEVTQAIKIEKEALSTITSSQKSGSSVFSIFQNQNTQEVLGIFHEKLYKFIYTSGLSIRQGMNVHLRDLLSYVVDNSVQLKKNEENLCMSYHKYQVEQHRSFSKTMHVLKSVICMSRQWYLETTGSNLPFLYVSHDIWETKKISVLGVSIHFIVPYIWKMEQFPIGLSHTTSHKANDILQQTNHLLAR